MGAQLRGLRIQIEQAKAEAAEVARLERSALRRVWWSAIGKSTRLERVRDEARSAAARLAALEAEHATVASAFEGVAQELSILEGVDEAYAQAFDARVQELLATPGPDRDAVRGLLGEVEEEGERARRIDDTLAITREVERDLCGVVETLERTRRVEQHHPGRGPAKWLGPQLERVRRGVDRMPELPPLAEDVRRLLAHAPLVQRGNPVATREAYRRSAGALDRLRRWKTTLRDERADVAARQDDAKRRLVEIVEHS